MIVLQQIDKFFNKGKSNEVHAVRSVDLKINAGEFVVLTGANGCGKSTLLNMIAGAIQPDNGNILLAEKNVTHLPEHKRSKYISRVFQNPLSGTAPDLTILDNFRLAALRSKSKTLSIGIDEQFKKAVKEKLSVLEMGLEHKLNQLMGSLSGGQRQALTLLMCTMDTGKILLLDEPTAALDPKSAKLVMETAERIIQQEDLTAILITHNLKDAQQFGNRLIHMSEGKIVHDLAATEKKQISLAQMIEWFN